MGLKDQLAADLKEAMKQGEALRRDTLRFLRAAVHNAEIAAGEEFQSDDQVIAVLAKEAKKSQESIEEFRKGGRDDLVEKETAQLAVIQSYLPQALSEDELRELVMETIAAVSAEGMRDLGKVMKELMPKVRGRADGKLANEIVRQALTGATQEGESPARAD